MHIPRVINACAPIRVCDNGGWTDTWFARYGTVFNIGVYPYAEVQIVVEPLTADTPRVSIFAENYGERFIVEPEALGWDRHPLLEAAVCRMGVPEDMAIKVSIYSEAPAGGSTGTSAAVSVALIGALDRLTPGRLSAHEIAYTAHAVETEMLHQQCGIQDQLCSAYGGINYIEMFQYPYACVSQISVPNGVWWELERRLALVYLGSSHSSSDVHSKVIKDLEGAGPDAPKLNALRRTARKSRDAVSAGDFGALGAAMVENTDAQANLNDALVSPEARQIIEIARSHGAIGWKVNGAGGDGGSITLLCGESSSMKRIMIGEIEQSVALSRNIPVYLSRFGLRVWETQRDVA